MMDARAEAGAPVAARVAAITLVAQAVLQAWVASATDVSMQLRAATLMLIAALAIALLASVSILAWRVPQRWALAGLLAWGVGWLAGAVDLGALIAWSFGAPPPVGTHQLHQLDPVIVQIIATAGGLAIGAALVASIRDVRVRHSAVLLLAGYAALGVIAALAEHRLALATDFPSVSSVRRDQHITDEIRAIAFAGMLWQYSRAAATARRAAAAADTSWSAQGDGENDAHGDDGNGRHDRSDRKHGRTDG